MKINKSLIAGATVGAVVGGAAVAYITSHKKEIKEKLKEGVNTLKVAGIAKLVNAKAAVEETLHEKQDAVKKIRKVVRKKG